MTLHQNSNGNHIPFELMEITLGDFIAYQDQYGRDLDIKLSNLLKKQYTGTEANIELQKNFYLENHLNLEALCWKSFWSKTEMAACRNEKYFNDLLKNYRVLRFVMKEETAVVHKLPKEINWNGNIWILGDYKITPASEITFNEVITSKELMHQISKVGKGKWEAMAYIACIFLRKKGEVFTDDLIQEGSDRMELMKKLPLKHAFAVAFFLISYVNTWKITSVFFQNVAERASLN